MNGLKKMRGKVAEMKFGKDAFWLEKYNSKDEKNIVILIPELRKYLNREGFKTYQDNLIQIKENIAELVTPNDVFIYTLKYIVTFKDSALESAFIKQGETIIIKNKAVLLGLSECDKIPLKDTLNKSYQLYRNGVVIVQDANHSKDAKEIEIIEYSKIDNFIWRDRIIDRDFEILEDPMEAMFSKFIRNISNTVQHYRSTCSAIGYLLHGYKDQRNPKGIIINDEMVNDNGKPQGGTGKGLIVKGISQIVERALYNGRSADFRNDKFAFENVHLTSRILSIDDLPRNFNMEDLFSSMTEDLIVRKIYKDPVIIPYVDCPKFVLTTNYTIRGNSSSFKRRRFDVFLTDHYSDNHTPSDDFKCEFFHGWDEQEWKRFDYFMMNCLSHFLTEGLVQYESKDIELKMFKNETSADFIELMDSDFSNFNERYYKKNLKGTLTIDYGDSYNFLSKKHRVLKDWLEQYAEFNGLDLEQGKDVNGRWFMFKKPDDG